MKKRRCIKISPLPDTLLGPGARFSKVPKSFRTRKTRKAIAKSRSNLDRFYSDILNMNRGSLHTKSKEFSVFKYPMNRKIGSIGPKRFRDFRETGRWCFC